MKSEWTVPNRITVTLLLVNIGIGLINLGYTVQNYWLTKFLYQTLISFYERIR